MNILASLYFLLSKKDRIAFIFLVFIGFFVSIIEIVSMSAMVLFISAMSVPSFMQTNRYCNILYQYIGCPKESHDFLVFFGIGLIILYITRAIINIAFMHAIGSFAYSRYHTLSTKMFNLFMRLGYRNFITYHSAEAQHTIFSCTGMVTHLFFASLNLANEICMVMCVYIMLFWSHWQLTLIMSTILGFFGWIVMHFFSKKIATAGSDAHHHLTNSTKILHESIGTIKLIKLRGQQDSITQKLGIHTQGYSNAQSMYISLQHIPRFVLETIGFVTLLGIILVVIQKQQMTANFIPLLSLYAIAFYRLLPSASKILASINQINFSSQALYTVIDFLKNTPEHVGAAKLSFNNTITVTNLFCGYDENKPILKNINLILHKGEKIALLGTNGAGKSTLVDSIIGLIVPFKGSIAIDGTPLTQDNLAAWRRMVAYVPQTIYLCDGTIADNIIFDDLRNEERIKYVLDIVGLWDFLITRQGIDTHIGEGGITLSGGQRQRLAIARALYMQPSLLILDEATANLDRQTESLILQSLQNSCQDVTIVIISHRVESITWCNRIYKIEHGTLQEQIINDRPTISVSSDFISQ